MSTQENKDIYAGFFVRLFAFTIDSIIAGCIALVIVIPVNVIEILMSDGNLVNGVLFHHTLSGVVTYIIVTMYFTLLTYFTHTTIGKSLFKLRVEHDKGEWTFVNILYRESIGRFLSSLLNIGYLVLCIDSKKRGFHDMLCDTKVVYSVKMVERKIIKNVIVTNNQEPIKN